MHRRSIRRYRPDAVPRKLLEEILLAGTLAPSSKNRQPWRFVVAAGEAKAEALSAMERGLERERTNPILPCSTRHLPGAFCTLNVMRQAPAVIFIVNALGSEDAPPDRDARVSEICNAQSIGAAIENMALAADERGLGTLWICDTFFAQDELRDWLAADGELYAALAVGYADEAPPARPRRRLSEVAEWRGFGKDAD